MTDEEFRKLCNTFGFAPSRALRELIDCVRAQEIEACASILDRNVEACINNSAIALVLEGNAMAIRARKEKT
jgi:hypothetical protein